MRALFARVGRSFKRLTPAQIDAWSSFAQQYSFGSRMEAKSPAVNAYVTLNYLLKLCGFLWEGQIRQGKVVRTWCD